MSAIPSVVRRARGVAFAGWLCCTLIGGLSIAYYLSYYNYSLNLTDEGFLVNGALRVLEGQVPVSGFYSYPPGRYYLLAAFFIALGVNIATERLMWIPLMVIRNLLVFSVGRRLLHPWVSLAVTLTVLLVPGPWYKTECSLLMFAHLELLFRYLAGPSARRALVLGVLTGSLLYFRHDFFAYGVIVCVITIPAFHLLAESFTSIAASRVVLRSRLILSVKHNCLVLAATAASTLPLLLFYGARGELAIFLRRMGPSGLATVSVVSEARQFPDLAMLAHHLSTLANHWPERFNIWFANVWFSYFTLLVLLCCVGLLAHGLVGWATGRASNAKQTVLLAGLLAWTAATAMRLIELPLFVAFLEISPGILLLTACLLSSLWTAARGEPASDENPDPAARLVLRYAATVLAVLFVGGILAFSWLNLLLYGLRCDTCGTIGSRQRDAVSLQVERAEVLLPPAQADELSLLIDEVQARTSADEGIFAFRSPMFYFLTQRKNPSRMDWPLSPVANAQESAELVAALREHPPKIEIVQRNSWLVHIISRYSCELQHTLFDNYDIVAREGDYILLERSSGSDGWTLLQSELTARGLHLTPAPGCEF